MNRYMIGMLVWLLLFVNNAGAQVTLKGPSEGQPGEAHVVNVEYQGKDLKINVLKDGYITEKGWLSAKSLEDKVFVAFMTKDEGIYSVIVSCNNTEKTYTAIHVIRIGPPKPPKPDPVIPDPNVPTPKPQVLAQELQLIYDKEKNPTALASLQDVIGEVKEKLNALNSFGDLETVLVNAGKRKMADEKVLRNTRDKIANYLVTKTGTDPRKWNGDLAKETIDEILSALKSIK